MKEKSLIGIDPVHQNRFRTLNNDKIELIITQHGNFYFGNKTNENLPLQLQSSDHIQLL